MKLKSRFSIALAFMLSTASLPSGAVMHGVDFFGNPVPASAAQRTVTIKPDTKYVNVQGGEIIKFVVGDKAFAWDFNSPITRSFKLNRIAPPGVLDREVMTYVAPNPLYLPD
ncbi:MAG: hypothetical protein JWQ21_2458 [Herminiimonas sp.]|nr:hypothetical protein [Herminiimonas sp.]